MDVLVQTNDIDATESSGTGTRNESTAVGGVRKCWATARERNRMKARYAIQQRVFCPNVPPDGSCDDAPGNVVSTITVHDNATNQCTKVRHILHRIIRGDTSYFSLQFMEEHFDVLNEPFPSEFLWESRNDSTSQETNGSKARILLDTVRLRSRLGRECVSELERYASGIDTCTILEYAVWLQRYRIVRQLIVGGIDPIHCRNTMTSPEQGLRAKEVGIQIRQLFLSGVIPLSLSCYVVSRVIGLRQSAWTDRQVTPDKSWSMGNSVGCMICGVTTDLLRYSSSLKRNDFDREDDCLSGHSFCEVCIWNDVLKHLNSREGDVVKCPICHYYNNASKATEMSGTEQIIPTEFALTSESNEAHRQLYETSLARFHALPVDSAIIKQITKKKKTPPERETVCSTWSDAVKPFIGATQTSRREKFFHFVEKGSYHHVKACIQQGIDLNMQNEYGQTAFFIAVWQHDLPLVRLLLYYGCNPYIVANGMISPYRVAKLYGYTTILALFEQGDRIKYANEIPTILLDESNRLTQSPFPVVTTLIDFSLDHPGAGSFVVDNFLEDSFVDALFKLWEVLPAEMVAKKKVGPCSERRYYCDAHRIVSKPICDVLMKEITAKTLPFQQILCGPFMRFLNYSTSGAVLAPHIDLSRTDPTSTQRSTHSFLLYLSTCRHGGETALLGAVTGDGRNQRLAAVTPKRGRILVFPHRCPHEGLVVVDTPKMLIRGELWVS